MDLYQRLLVKRQEEERRRGRTSGRDEDTDSTVFPRKPVDTSENRSQDQRRTDLRRMKSLIRFGVTNRWEAGLFATLRKKYPDEYWDLRYGRL